METRKPYPTVTAIHWPRSRQFPADTATDALRSLFVAFPDLDFEVTRTIAGDEVVVLQWTFTGTNTGPLGPPAFRGASAGEPTGRIVRLRGVAILDVADSLVRRETLYYDQATILVALGVAP